MAILTAAYQIGSADNFLSTLMTTRERRLIEIYRLEGTDITFAPCATEEQRLDVIRRFHEMEVEAEYYGRGYRKSKWFTDEFLKDRWKGQ